MSRVLTKPSIADEVADLIVPLGMLIAVVAPYFVFSTSSNDSIQESKLLAQAAGGVLSLVGLGIASRQPEAGIDTVPVAEGGIERFIARVAPFGLLLLSLLVALSAIRGSRFFDPLTLVTPLAAGAVFLCGTSRRGAGMADRVFHVLMAAGAASGLLAGLQRFTGILRLPLDAPEPRFFAMALIGNPGNVAGALVPCGLLFWMTATSNRQSARSRALALAGLTLVALGGAATESIVPALAVGTGIALHTLMDFRRRARFLAVALGLFLLASTFSGTGRRAWAKLKELQAGQIAAAMTQRDIGVLAALEMVQRHPVLGVGPGCFENAFVPARLAAEARRERHMVHLSNSAHFENAHIEPLTIAAECGLPAALVCLSLTLGVLAALFLRQRREHEAEDGQERMTETLLVLLAASLVLSLGGFPLRFAATAAPIAFVAGLAFHRIGVIGVNGGSPRQAASLPPRTHLLVFVVLLSSLAALRCVAWLTQARAEAELHAAGMSQGAQRDRFLSRARHSLETSVQARPRKASAWLALGSVARLEGSREESLRHTLHSLWLEERAETDFNLGLLSLEMGRTDEARALFVRAVWILPRLLNAIPEGGDPGLVEMELREAEARISDGASAPKLPSSTPSPEF